MRSIGHTINGWSAQFQSSTFSTETDFAGPITLKNWHTQKPVFVKGYVCLFVCFTTRAIHLELVADLSTDAFLACIQEVRCKPWMSRGTVLQQWLWASHELARLYEMLSISPTAELCVISLLIIEFGGPLYQGKPHILAACGKLGSKQLKHRHRGNSQQSSPLSDGHPTRRWNGNTHTWLFLGGPTSTCYPSSLFWISLYYCTQEMELV